MSEKASKTLIGAFVLGAVALILIAVTVIGSGQLFSKPLRFVMFFESSLKGLSAGSPVVFRGVPIGRVSSIRMSGDVDTMEFLIPVYIEIDESIMQTLKATDDGQEDVGSSGAPYLHRMIKKGMRARLNNQSLLTGQLLIELDFFTDQPKSRETAPHDTYDSLPVIPTIPSQFDAAWQRIARLPVDQLAQKLVDIMVKVDNLLDDPEVRALPGNLNTTLTEARATVRHLDTAIKSFHELAATANTVAATVDKQTPETFERLRRLLDTYTKLASELDHSLEGVRGVLGPNTVTILEINRTVREITETARAVRGLANTLERNPESLLRGKGAERK